MHSGTYGKFDEVSGALILASSLATDDIEVTVLLRGDGVYTALEGQEPNDIGLENNLTHLESAVEMGVRVVALSSSLEERGLKKENMVEYLEIIDENGAVRLVSEHEHWLPF